MNSEHGSIKNYTIGFVLSLIATVIPYIMVTESLLSGTILLLMLAGFAVLQIFVQLVYFLHINRENKPRWHSMTFGFMVIVVIIVVFGSLWIMNNLHYHMMPGEDVETYIKYEEAIE